MYDRNVEYPNRYQLVKVEGTDDIYDLVPAPGRVDNDGTLINKNSLLKDATAALFGMGADAVPDDALQVLSRFQKGLGNEYVWEKTKSETKIVTTTSDSVGGPYSSSAADIIKCSKEAAIENGEIVLVNPVTYTYAASNRTAIAEAISGGYFISPPHNLNTPVKDNGSVFDTSRYELYYQKLAVQTETTSYGFLNSPDPNAYPINDGYTYTPLGMLGDKTRIETGTYEGTNAYGGNNKNSLTFSFEPKAVFISGDRYMGFWFLGSTMLLAGAGLNAPNSSVTPAFNERPQNDATLSGNTLTWYNGQSAYTQLNANKVTYRYVAIG